MGWYTYYWRKTEIEGSFKTKKELSNEIKSIDQRIKQIKDKLRGLVVMTEPHKLLNCGDRDPIDVLKEMYQNLIEELTKCVKRKRELCIISYNWNKCHDKDGNPIDYPDDSTRDNCYMGGDFLKTLKYPDGNSIF